MKFRYVKILVLLPLLVLATLRVDAQINAEQVMRVGQNALYFEDYMLSIQYFNQAIQAKPYLAQPYFMRAIAKLNLEDYMGAEADATAAIERNPFIADAYEVRGVARQNRGKHIDAIEDYNSALQLQPQSRGLLFNKALAQQEIHQTDSALASFNKLLEHFPGYENGYVGRARLYLQMGDTIAAETDIDKALSLNKSMANAYLLKADIAMNGHRDYSSALDNMSEAIKLLPRESGLYVNRAFMRYNLDDYFGAMADYDYAIQLDPLNVAAIYNRGLLRMEVHDNDNAIKDFTSVLNLNPDDYHSMYNRAYLYTQAGYNNEALADINVIIDRFPEFPEALYMRSNLYRQMGDNRRAMRDYDKAMALAKNIKSDVTATDSPHSPGAPEAPSDKLPTAPESSSTPELSAESVAHRFTALRTIQTDVDIDEEYNNKNIRGKVQDRQRRIELEPMFALSYYTEPTELAPQAYYMKEIDDVNATRMLRFVIELSNDDIALDDERKINAHFKSIDYYNSYLSTHKPRAIDYLGRAMDFMMLRDYTSAITDLTKAINLTPDFALAYFQRAIARHKAMQAGVVSPDSSAQVELRAIIDDFNRAIELSPRMVFAFFNKGNLYVEMGDLTSALLAYNKAIELKPDFGEAYYNRGYVQFQLGNHEKGVEDMSKAGELGVVPSYNLIKKMKN